jgi:Family of unknown function (DUF6527)
MRTQSTCCGAYALGAEDIGMCHDCREHCEFEDIEETTMKTGIELIAAERERQITAEGWSAAHDDEHDHCELSAAADCYMATAALQVMGGCGPDDCQDHWPWDGSWWKPSYDPIRNLVKAGALIAAEIDRLQRMPPAQNQSMKAQPLKQMPDGSQVYCEPAGATHIWIMTPGPFRNRFIPIILKGTREGTGCWTWNGDTDKPTLRPSLLTWDDNNRCHTWITDGQVIFLGDCSHEYAGQTLDLLDMDKLPEPAQENGGAE